MQTEDAVALDNSLEFRKIPVAKIFADEKFNCRGHISPSSVIDLMRDITDRGLLQPVVVRHRTEDDPPQYDYALILGFRRHAAYKYNGYEYITARVVDVKDEFKYRTMNAVENLKRTDLNILQEAKCVEPYRRAGWSREEIAKELGKSPGWVQIRNMVLDLPEEIQECAAAGVIKQEEIRDIHALKVPTKQFEAVKLIKEAKEKGDYKKNKPVIKKTIKPLSKCHRKRPELLWLMHQIQQTLGNNFTTRVLAWAAGEITSVEVYDDLKTLCKEKGVNYEFPDYEEKADA